MACSSGEGLASTAAAGAGLAGSAVLVPAREMVASDKPAISAPLRSSPEHVRKRVEKGLFKVPHSGSGKKLELKITVYATRLGPTNKPAMGGDASGRHLFIASEGYLVVR